MKAKSPHALHPETGEAVCGAKTKTPNKFGEHVCLNRPTHNGRCRFHGGQPRVGAANPNYRHGRYARRDASLPPLGELVERNLRDPDFLSVQQEVALIRARIEQLSDQVAAMAGDPGLAPKLATRAYDMINRGVSNANTANIYQGLGLLEQALQRRNAELESWGEIRDTMGTLRSLLSSEMTKEKLHENYISNADFILLANMMQGAILEALEETEAMQRKAVLLVTDEAERERVTVALDGGKGVRLRLRARMQEVLMHQRLLVDTTPVGDD